jgi:uncharacterized protein YukE
MAFEGMDPDQVEHYGNQLLTEAANVGHLIQQIQSNVTAVAANWVGQDSDQFQQEWSGNYIRQMQQAENALATLGHAALSNASEQRNTSSHL